MTRRQASTLLAHEYPGEPAMDVDSRSQSSAEPSSQSDHRHGHLPRSGRRRGTNGPITAFLSGMTRRVTRREEPTRQE